MTPNNSAPLRLGDTFFYRHLWVVCTLPDAERRVIAINMTTMRLGSDTSCIIRNNEHPYVAHDTVMNYEQAIEWDISAQQGILDRPESCPPKAPVRDVILTRIQNGALKSTFASPKVQQRIRESMAEQAKPKAEETTIPAASGTWRRRW
jgi:hypothetical protein